MAKTGGGRSKWGKASGKGPEGSSSSSSSSSTTTPSSPTRRLKKGGKRGRRLCHKEGCTLCPSFGFEGDVAVSCSHHKEEGMRNLTARRCQHEGCFTVANFGMPGDKPGFCAAHSTEGMVNRNKPRGGEGTVMTVARSSRRTAKTSNNSNSEASGMLEAGAVAATAAVSEASPGVRSRPPPGGKDLLMRAATARARMEVALGVSGGDRYGAPAPSKAMTMGGRGRLQESDDLDIKDESSLTRLVNGRNPVLVRRGCAARGKGMGGVSHKRSLASMSMPMALPLSVPMSPSSGSGSACGSPAAMFISRGEGMIDSFSAGSPSSSPLSKREDYNKLEGTGRGGRAVSLSRNIHGKTFGAATVLRPPPSSSSSSRQHQHDCFDEFHRTVSNVCGTMGSRLGGGTGGHVVVPVCGSSSSSRGGVGKAPLNLDFSGDFRGGELMDGSFRFIDEDCCLERNGHVDDMDLEMEMGATLDDILGVDEDDEYDEDEASLAGRGGGRCSDSSPAHSGLRTSSANGAALHSRGGLGLTDLSCVDASSEPVDSVIGVGDGGSNDNGNNNGTTMDFELDHLPELTSVDLSGLNTHTGDSACASGRDPRRQQQQNRGSACSLRIGSNGNSNGNCNVNGIRNINGSSNTPTSSMSTGAIGSPVAAAAAAAVAAVRSTPSGASTPARPPPPGPTGSPAGTQTDALVLPKPPGDEEWWDVLEGEDFMAMPDSIWDTQHSQHDDAAGFVEVDSDGRRSGGGDGFFMIPGDGCGGVVGVGTASKASSMNKNKNNNAGGLSHQPAKRRRQASIGGEWLLRTRYCSK